MPGKISEKIREKIFRLYKQGKSKKDIADQTGVSYSYVYGLTRLKERGFESFYDYTDYTIRKRGFESQREYACSMAKKRARKKENRNLSNLIIDGLKKLGKSQYWLSQQLGISHQIISIYASGKSVPGKEKLDRLIEILPKYSFNKLENLTETD